MIKVGTCGFSFKDWKGTVYPEKIKDRDVLPFYNRELGFDTVEIDVSYYTIVSQRAVESWVNKTDDDFTFAIKCNREMTLNEMGRVNPAEIDNELVFNAFLRTFEPMTKSGKLLTFLAQFGPVFFKNRENVDYLKRFRERFKELPLTVEFRHKSWLTDREKEDTFKVLKDNNLGYAAVDEPKVRSLAPLVTEATDEIGYLRLHGRNKQWFESDAGERYNYFYSDEELEGFMPIIESLAIRTAVTGVYFNNCHAGAALKNAIKMRQLLQMAGYMEKASQKEKPGQMTLPF